MGIENHSRRRQNSYTTGLITPHGDRKPRVVYGETSPIRTHYPSWGSKTLARFTGTFPRLGLITPHGDRKLGARFLRCEHNVGDSLPLMGIENTETRASSDDGETADSLPLMGIENRVVHGETDTHCPLITPHGDRKLGLLRSAARAVFWSNSLPLMGIENRLRGAELGVHPRLITPHGDRKLQEPARGVSHNQRLITPHGDRKRGNLSLIARRVTSLPLMGIENLIAPAIRMIPGTSQSHYPSWGSKTTWQREAGSSATGLITPHGDRKPWVDIPSAKLPPVSHYPSWGSKTSQKGCTT